MMFVDGSNLFGVGRHLNVQFKDYQALFKYLFDESVKQWQASFSQGAAPPAQLVRIYWYVVGSIDEWDLTEAQALTHLRREFDNDIDIRPLWMKNAGQTLAAKGGKPTTRDVADEAWNMCFNDFKTWYEKKRRILEGMNRFHYAVEAGTDFIEIRRVGHWKVHFLNKSLEEKGVDTSFAVDMATMLPFYDVAVLISGDADGIPSVRYAKNAGKHVGAVEFLKGYPPEDRAKNVSAKLKVVADFVAPIYEMTLVKDGLAQKPDDGKPGAATAAAPAAPPPTA